MTSAAIAHRQVAWAFGAVVLAATASASAGVRYTVETVTTYKDQTYYEAEDTLIDGNAARIDIRTGTREQTQPKGSMLTTDGGKTWAVVEGSDAVCGTWDMAAYYRKAGSLLETVERWFNVTVKEAKVEVASREPGPAILGFATTHVRIVSRLKATARVLFIQREIHLQITDDVWYAPEVGVEPVEQRWLDAMQKTGYDQLDRMTGAALAAVGGFVLKQKTVAVAREPRKNRERAKVDEISVTKFERTAPDAVADELRPLPGCKPVSDEQLEEAAKDLLKSIIRR